MDFQIIILPRINHNYIISEYKIPIFLQIQIIIKLKMVIL